MQSSKTNKPGRNPTLKTHGEQVPDNLLIVPGQRIGTINLGCSTDSVVSILGRPDRQDAAMGAMMMVWFAKHNSAAYRTSIYAHRNYNGKDENTARVKAIRITSPEFKTNDGMGVGTDLNTLKKHYQLNSNASQPDQSYTVYDDNQKGIAFEIGSGEKCSAVIVFVKGGSSVAYLNLQ